MTGQHLIFLLLVLINHEYIYTIKGLPKTFIPTMAISPERIYPSMRRSSVLGGRPKIISNVTSDGVLTWRHHFFNSFSRFLKAGSLVSLEHLPIELVSICSTRLHVTLKCNWSSCREQGVRLRGTELPTDRGTELPAGGGTELLTGGGTKLPAGRGTKLPIGGATKLPASRGTKLPAGGATKLSASI